MLNTNKIKLLAISVIIPFLMLINSCEQATVKPITQIQTIKCVDADLIDNLIAYYPFTDGSLDNYVNTGYDLTSSNPIEKTNDRSNNPNCAIYMNQNNQDQALFVNGGDPLTDSNMLDKDYSIAMWYKPLEGDKRAGYETLIANSNGNRYEDNWSIALYDCRRATAVFNKKYIWDNIDIQQFGTCEAIVNYYTGSWFHLVLTHKNGTLNMYINGKLVSTSDDVTNFNPGKDGSKMLYIGKDFRGNLDEIMLFNKELSWDDVLKLYSATPCCE